MKASEEAREPAEDRAGNEDGREGGRGKKGGSPRGKRENAAPHNNTHRRRGGTVKRNNWTRSVP